MVYKDIDLTQEKITNQIKGKIELYETEEKDEKTVSLDTVINVQGKVIVKYIDIDTNKEITRVGASSARPQDETYRYEITGKVGTEYRAERKEIEDYIYVRAVNETGKIKESTQEAIYYYKTAEVKVIVKYQDTEGNNIEELEVITGKVGDDYKVEKKEIENYKYIETRGNEEGKMTEEDIEIIYIYEREAIGKAVVKYVDIDTNEEIVKDYVSARTKRKLWI